MNKLRVLLVNCPRAYCSTYESGVMIWQALLGGETYDVHYAEVDRFDQLARDYDVYAFNYHDLTMAWLQPEQLRGLSGVKLAFVLQTLPHDPFVRCPDMFDAYCVPDPTLTISDPRVWALPRPLDDIGPVKPFVEPEVPVIGTFGLASPGKGFEAVVWAATQEFERAVVRINVARSTYCDPTGELAEELVSNCRNLAGPGIELRVTHDYMGKGQLIDWCIDNTLNVFLYHRDQPGLAAATDQAIAAARPMLVSPCDTFRHIHPYIEPYPAQTLRRAIADTLPAVLRMKQDWSAVAFRTCFEAVLATLREGAVSDTVLMPARPARDAVLFVSPPGWKPEHDNGKALAAGLVESKQYRLTHAECGSADDWLHAVTTHAPRVIVYDYHRSQMPWLTSKLIHQCNALHVGALSGTAAQEALPAVVSTRLNRSLDDNARDQYAPIVSRMEQLGGASDLPRADVQQAFVVDTFERFAIERDEPRTLCVGSFGDSACSSLQALGHDITAIDTVENHDLDVFSKLPTTEPAGFDIVFSTSVLAHVDDDERFAQRLAGLVAPGGVLILTCDFKHGWRRGDPLPTGDRRLYTGSDFRERLLPVLAPMQLVDEPDWSGMDDFESAGCRFSFATLVLRKAR